MTHQCDFSCNHDPIPAIAPPVAAGSVDSIETNEFGKLLIDLYAAVLKGDGKKAHSALIAHIHNWGAQQRQYGWDQCATLNQEAIRQQRERAEKAEARVKKLQEEIADLQLEMQDERQRNWE